MDKCHCSHCKKDEEIEKWKSSSMAWFDSSSRWKEKFLEAMDVVLSMRYLMETLATDREGTRAYEDAREEFFREYQDIDKRYAEVQGKNFCVKR